MPDAATLTLFAFAALAMAATPGPDMLLIATRSTTQGPLAGFATWAGIATGTYCHALAAALGLSQLFILVPVAYDVVRVIGAAYLLYLAWQAVTSPNAISKVPSRKHRTLSGTVMFKQGLLTNLLNPKMVIFVLALFPQFISPSAGPIALQIMVFATILNAIGLIVNGAVILTASHLRRSLGTSRWLQNGSRYLLGTVFAGLAARLAFDTPR